MGNLSGEQGKVTPPQALDSTRYKKIAIEKYLDGEIDTGTLYSILDTLEHKKGVSKPIDLAYQ
jgi:hypothetical protein